MSNRLVYRKRVLVVAIGGLGMLLFLAFIVPLFVPWTPLNCTTVYVDIHTGRLRHTRHLFFVLLSDRVTETLVSEALPAAVRDAAAPDWRRVVTLSPGVGHSPHYGFHGAGHQFLSFGQWWDELDAPADIRRITAERLIAIWQETDSYFRADDYLFALYRMTRELSRDDVFTHLRTGVMPNRLQDGDDHAVIEEWMLPP
jgi:hypothetical protein